MSCLETSNEQWKKLVGFDLKHFARQPNHVGPSRNWFDAAHRGVMPRIAT